MRPYVLSLIISLIVTLNGFGVAFAESGSSTDFRLTMEQNSHQGTSSDYNLCGVIRSAGALGSSTDFSIYPSLPCEGVTTPAPTCGNGIIDAGEQCDGANLGGATCASLGYNSGTLSCSATCTYAGCYQVTTGGGDGGGSIPTPPSHQAAPEEPEPVLPVCGNAILEEGEGCDDGNRIDGDGCSAMCTIEKPVEEYIPAEVIPEPKPKPRPVVKPEEKPDFIFITNDITPLLFGKFIDSDDFSVTFRQEDKYIAVSIEALDDFLSFKSKYALENGIYNVYITDNRDPLYSAHLEIEVDTEESIPVPYIEAMGRYVFEDQDFENTIFIFENRQPIIRGRTEKPALIGIYSLQDGTVKVLETDENNEFEFIPPRPLNYGAGEYRIVALYEDRLSKEVRIKFDVPMVCGPCRILGADLPNWVCILLLILAVLAIIMTALYSCCRKERGAQRKPYPKSPAARKGLFGLFSVFLSLMIIGTSSVYALDTTPSFMTYNGILKDSSGNPVASSTKNLRFSLWTSDDFNSATDLSGGNINTGAANYASWQETQSVTTDASGYFEVYVGTVSTDPWPNFNDAQHPYLQIEIQGTAGYQLIDPDGVDNTNDRFDIGSEPFARNSDYLDNKEIGTSTGDIVVLGVGNVFPISTIPAGTNQTSWHIDDSDVGGIINLGFGSLLANHILSWDPNGVAVGDGWFNFNDDVNIQGNITLTGTVDGVDISNLQFTDIQPRAKSVEFIPEFPSTTIQQLGPGGHRGRVDGHFDDADGPGAPNNYNHYTFTTQQAVMQDITLVTLWTIPLDFTSWQATPMVFRYKTATANTADNKIDVSIEDSTGTNIGTLTGNSNLVNTSWTTTNIGFGGGGTFTPGTFITIKIKMSATNAGEVNVGDMKLNYNGR